MGGDFAPANVVEGALAALDESKGRLALVLVGQQERIEDELRKLGHPTSSGRERFQGLLSVRHAPEVIDMHDPPTAALRTKKDSSIAVGLRLHTEGGAQALLRLPSMSVCLTTANNSQSRTRKQLSRNMRSSIILS